MVALKNILPCLPTGVSVVERTREIELGENSISKWRCFIETLKVIDSTQSIKMDIQGFNKNKIAGIKAGLKYAGTQLNFKPLIKFSIIENTLYIWSNK